MDPKNMKVFSRDPFAVEPLPKAFYYPSPERHLSRSQKTTSIDPSRPNESWKEEQPYEDERGVSPMDEIFLKGTNTYQPKARHHDTADDEDFDESWPNSERPSSLSLTGLEEESSLDMSRFQTVIDRFANLSLPKDGVPDQEKSSSSAQRLRQPGSAKHGATVQAKSDKISMSKLPQRVERKTNTRTEKAAKSEHTEGKATGSVLHRYIERFRNSAPMSREDREQQQQSSSQDFWWLASGPPGGHPGGSERPGHSREVRPVPSREVEEEQGYQSAPLTEENLHKYSQWEQNTPKHAGHRALAFTPGDKKTIELQERAEKLLEKSSSTVLSADPAVSTEGLGSNMSDMSSMEEYPYRPAFTAYIDRERTPVRRPDRSRGPGSKPAAQDGRHPEDDPLHQWRLRRKMEQAQEMTAKNVQTFDFMAKSEKEKQVDGQLEEFRRKLSGKPEPPECSRQMTSSRGEFTPAPQVAQNAQATYPVSGVSEPRPQIASPVLHRGRARREPEREVDPHLHLMCDLLPCPHQPGSSEPLPQAAPQPRPHNAKAGADKLQQYLQAEKPDVDNRNGDRVPINERESRVNDKRSEKNDNEFNEETTSEPQTTTSNEELTKNGHKEMDSDKENNKQKAVRVKDADDKLQRESLQGDQYKKRGRDRRKEGADEDREKRNDQTERQGDDRRRVSREEREERTEKQGGSRSDRDSRKEGRNGDREKRNDHTERQGDNRRQESQEQREEQTEKQEGSRSNRDSRKEGRDGDRAKRDEQTDRQRGSRRSERLPKPRQSSSPNVEDRKGLDHAIGQAVKHHLFSMSTSTVLSSVESLPPSASVERLPSSTSGQHLSSLPEQPDRQTEESDESDGEFGDDQLLQMLRRQRAIFEQQLQEIDHHLEGMESR